MSVLDTKDPYLMLSLLNTKLRDECHSLEDLCKTYCLDRKTTEIKMHAIGYQYDQMQNQFIG